MRTSRKPDKRAKKLQKRYAEPAAASEVQKSMKLISQEIKAEGVNELAQGLTTVNSENIKCLDNRTNRTKMLGRSALLDIYPKQTLHPGSRIKLQLFPLNEETRMALEKDGYYPYLELTLRARKKISSVISHLICKWERSSIARGKLMLFPYSKPANPARGLRWTLDDCDISAGDVYGAVGRSSIFRLRYGWVYTSIPFQLQLPSKGVEKDCDRTEQNIRGECEKSEEMMYELKSGYMNDVNKTAASEKIVDSPINQMIWKRWKGSFSPHFAASEQYDKYDRTFQPENEPRVESGLQQSSNSALLNIDSLTNISMGALLSEASLLGKCSNWDSKITGSDKGVQPAQRITDSLDACIAAQINFSQVPKQTNNDQHSSILDAEETCHAFPTKKFSSSRKDIMPSDANAGDILQDANSKLFKFPKTPQNHSRSELPQELACRESKTYPAFCLRPYHDESSLGLSGIKWNDSLGPFDLGLPVSRKASSGDNTSMNGFVR